MIEPLCRETVMCGSQGSRDWQQFFVTRSPYLIKKESDKMANEDDRFFLELGNLIKRFPAKSITLIFSSIVFLFGIGWSASKLLTPPTNIRERAAIEDAFRKHNISIPNQSDVVALIHMVLLGKQVSKNQRSLEE